MASRAAGAAFVLAVIAPACVGLAPASRASAAPTGVAIVIAGKGTHCVKWHSGITGDEILNDVATVKYRPSDGLITQIDGTPANNRADTTHYWSYWHNTGSGWTYSTVGANAYQPKAGTVEGWKFVNGSSTATPPPLKSYAGICGSTAGVPLPPRSSAAPRPTSSSAAPPARSPAPPAAGSRTAPSSAAHPTAPSATSGSAHRSTTTAASGSAPAQSAAATAPSPGVSSLHARPASAHRSSGSALPTVVVAVLVVVLGGSGWLASRRRRSTP